MIPGQCKVQPWRLTQQPEKMVKKSLVRFIYALSRWELRGSRTADIGLDGTFLKHNIQIVLLTPVGRDPNNQIYPIAWAVVSGENHDNWWWFIHKLKINLDLGDGEGFDVISDIHRSIINGMAVELPKVEHRACARHIYGNLKKNHKSDTLKPLF